MTDNMASGDGVSNNKKLLKDLVLPSWLSGLTACTTTVAIIGLTVTLTHLGGTVQQSLLGLKNVYTQSPLGTTLQTVSANYATNTYLNNVLLFILWASVGLMVYSIVQAILTEFGNVHNFLREIRYINGGQHILRDTLVRLLIKVLAFASWWILFRYTIFNLAPYTIAAAHTSAVRPVDLIGWAHCLLAALLCILAVHGLTILLRLSVLRARVFGEDIE